MEPTIRETTSTFAWAAARDPANRLALALLVSATAFAWVGLVAFEGGMGAVPFLTGWTLMMAAMMLPSIAPLIVLHRGPRVPLTLGYLSVWTAVGLIPFAAMSLSLEPATPVILGLAGVYELSPLKAACLRRCASAAAFLMEHYRSGSFRLGVEHGLWCLGCCVGLMAVLVFAGSMGLGWAVAIAAVVFAQKVVTDGQLSARVVGIGLVGGAVGTALA